MLYHVVRVNRNNLDTHAALTRSEALDLAMPDDGDLVEFATVEAPEPGAARISVPAGAWRRACEIQDEELLSLIASHLDRKDHPLDNTTHRATCRRPFSLFASE